MWKNPAIHLVIVHANKYIVRFLVHQQYLRDYTPKCQIPLLVKCCHLKLPGFQNQLMNIINNSVTKNKSFKN